MRTKTMILSGVVAALISASAMAQVYSLNAVGYINVSVAPGFTIIADQLYANGQGVAQFLSGIPSNANSTPGLLDTQLLDGQHNSVTLFKQSGNGWAIVTAGAGAWTAFQATGANGISLNPGEGIYIYNPFSTNFTLTFVGTVPQGTTLTNTLSPGFNIVSSVVPQTGDIIATLGLTPAPSDTVFILSGNGWDIWSANANGTSWTAFGNATAGSVPSPAVGQGFYYFVYGSQTEVWTRSFSIN